MYLQYYYKNRNELEKFLKNKLLPNDLLVSRNRNITVKIIENFNIDWDWKLVSRCQANIWNFILKNRNLDWDWDYLSSRSDLLFVEPFMDKLNFKRLHKKFLNIEFVKKYRNEDLNWVFISEISSLRDIEENLDLKWDWCSISNNLNLNVDFLKKYVYKNFDWFDVCRNKSLKVCELLENENILPLSIKGLSANLNLTVEIVKNYKKNWWYILFNSKLVSELYSEVNTVWGWVNISGFEKINNEFIERFQDNICWSWLSHNNYLTLSILERWIDRDWDFYAISSSNILTFDFVKCHIDKKWNFYRLTSNPVFSIRQALELYDKNLRGHSRNPNLTSDFVLKNKNLNWDWGEISINPFITNKIVYEKEKKRDIKRRRRNVESMFLFRDLNFVCEYYIGYF